MQVSIQEGNKYIMNEILPTYYYSIFKWGPFLSEFIPQKK